MRLGVSMSSTRIKRYKPRSDLIASEEELIRKCLQHKFRRWDIRDGQQTKERFGFSIASLGDIDKDGYGDFAVGAPYFGGSLSEGRVYIFRGSKSGVRERADQIIRGSDVRTNIRSFGFSLAGGADLDSNLYTDLVVGAAQSAQTVLLR